jgi:hypothetical protein
VQILRRDRTGEGRTVDISVGGLSLRTDLALRIDDAVRLTFLLPTAKAPITAHGTVCWTRSGVAGIRFLSLRAIEVRAIHALVKK